MFWSQQFGCWGQNMSRIQNKEVYATLCLQANRNLGSRPEASCAPWRANRPQLWPAWCRILGHQFRERGDSSYVGVFQHQHGTQQGRAGSRPAVPRNRRNHPGCELYRRLPRRTRRLPGTYNSLRPGLHAYLLREFAIKRMRIYFAISGRLPGLPWGTNLDGVHGPPRNGRRLCPACVRSLMPLSQREMSAPTSESPLEIYVHDPGKR